MSIVINKGVSFSASYASASFSTLDDINWQGVAKLYSSYPSTTPIISITMTKGAAAFELTIAPADIVNLDAGVYTLEVTITNAALAYSSVVTEAVTIVPATVIGSDKTTLHVSVCKSDGTPAGREVRSLSNALGGAVATLSWEGVPISVSHPVADNESGTVVGTETVVVRTNAAGYAQLSVIKGHTVVVSCPAFGKSVTVDTTGLDTIDLSSYF